MLEIDEFALEACFDTEETPEDVSAGLSSGHTRAYDGQRADGIFHTRENSCSTRS